MRVLLDTHVLVWWLSDAAELTVKARAIVTDPETMVFVSAVSVWELRIKEGLKKVELPSDFAAVLAEQPFEALPVSIAHAHAVKDLPLHHRDPFDRMLIAQARCDGLTLLTHDEVIARYDVAHVLV